MLIHKVLGGYTKQMNFQFKYKKINMSLIVTAPMHIISLHTKTTNSKDYNC